MEKQMLHNVLCVCLHLDVRGSLQTHRHQRKEKFFKKIPGRLCFKLTSLVPRVLLDDGYVFLGFTKDGQFVISYSLQVDTDENTGFLPVYVYNLQWWWFIPYKPLKKVSEVRLFENGIEPDIFIAICEWPADRSKILVYGHSVPRSREEGSQCFITITAVPPLNACKDCYISESNSSCTKRKKKVMCVKHSFCIYSKYELAPPFPAFIPQIQLKMDGMVVLNTGDSLVALDFRINQPVTQCNKASNSVDECKRLFSCGSTNPASANSGVDGSGSRAEAYHHLINGYYDFRGSPTGSSDSAAESDEDCWGKNNPKGLQPNKPSSTSVSITGVSNSLNTNNTAATNNMTSTSCTNTTNTTTASNVTKCCQRTRLHSVNPSNADAVEQYTCCSACCGESTTNTCCRHSKTSGYCWNCNCENSCPPSLNNSSGGGDDSTNRCMKQSCCTVCDRTLTSTSSCHHHHHHHHHHHLHNSHLHHNHHHLATNFSSPPPPPPTSSCCDLHTRLSDSNSKWCRMVKQRNSCSSCCVIVDTAKSDATSPPPAPPPTVFQRSSKLNVLEECRCSKKNGTASSVVSHHSKCYCNATSDSDTKENIVESTSQPLSPSNNISQQPFFSPNSNSGSSATQNSNENLPVYLHINESRSMSFSMRKFTYLEDSSRENILLNEDDFDLAYRSILPLDVRGADHKLMSITKSNVDSDQSDHITVCQLTLDIEHFLEEVIHTVAEWGHRYIAFLNYDLQLLDVNAESGEVLAKVFALVQARKDFNEKKTCKRSNILKQYYQTSITFNWSLLTGNYSTFHIEDLVEVDESDLLRKEWNPGNGEVTRLQHALAVPQSFYKSVYTLTNEAVIRGNSLSLILAPHHFVAISR
ncbi:DDB1- and CUL4-associated factor 15 isoform X2 [Octopus bimaculoides]|uniref:DDB1- and CUL4-associated factor 15 isoform X2 n=1 Tax=Octopus bimaculoides TaxID=37653 RepID=UPI0022E59E24|nr:DDB1- and CUL4-associated factor 15 isoform X2 [Octopus bimaculoides]